MMVRQVEVPRNPNPAVRGTMHQMGATNTQKIVMGRVGYQRACDEAARNAGGRGGGCVQMGLANLPAA